MNAARYVLILSSSRRAIHATKAVTSVHVNLVDLLEAASRGRPKMFDTETDLAEYTRKTGKIFPRNDVDAGSLLKSLLRHIFNPDSSRGKELGTSGIIVNR